MQYFSKSWFLSTQPILSLWFQLPFVLSVLCTESWAALVPHWLKNGLFTLHFFWNAPTKIPSFSTCIAPKHFLLLPLSSTCHPPQRLTSAYSYPIYYCQQLRDEYSLCLALNIVLLHLLTQLQMASMLSPEVACYQGSLYKHLWTFSFSPGNLLLPECHTKTWTRGRTDCPVARWPIFLFLCRSTIHLCPSLIVNSFEQNCIWYREITTMKAI